MMKISRIASVVTLLVLATASPALAARKADHQVPITGTVTGVHWVVPEEFDIAQPWQYFSEGTGQMSHLGRVDYFLAQDSTFDFDNLVVVSTGTVTFTAANGDMLVIAQDYTSQIVGEMEGFTIEGTWTVVENAGSGRFASATGSGTMEAVGDIPGGDALFGLPDGGDRYDYTGRIAYDASDRSNQPADTYDVGEPVWSTRPVLRVTSGSDAVTVLELTRLDVSAKFPIDTTR